MQILMVTIHQEHIKMKNNGFLRSCCFFIFALNQGIKGIVDLRWYCVRVIYEYFKEKRVAKARFLFCAK